MQKNIIVKGAKVHNLKNISLELPRNQFVVVTGVSGSGKSSLAFDTLYAEGQRRYVESLSSYARQFLGKIQKPDVDHILGIPPSIAIEQKVNTKNPRSTVGTSTEIYDYLKLLFARIGTTVSPISNQVVKRNTVNDVTQCITDLPIATKVYICAPIQFDKASDVVEQLQLLKSQGFSRLMLNSEVIIIDKFMDDFSLLNSLKSQEVYLLIDRVKVANEVTFVNRIADSIQTAFYEGKGICEIFYGNDVLENQSFSNKFELDGIRFEEASVNLFTFNNPLGACPKCEGFGKTIGIDEDLVIPNKNLSIFQNAIMPWRGEKLGLWKEDFIYAADKFDFPIHKPFFELTEAQTELLWTGNKYFKGLHAFFHMLEKESYKIQNRVILSKYRGKTVCPECKGKRLRKEAFYVKIGDKGISDLVDISILKLAAFFKTYPFTEKEHSIAKRILLEINSRLDFLINVGLGYLTLNRLSSTLSGGESQRINLATSLGSSLVGSLYILDEPSIGLHSHDTEKLIKVLRELQQLGNTVLVVEHDEDIMLHADSIIDMGPEAGTLGGEVVFQGPLEALKAANNTLTAQYLNFDKQIEVPSIRRKWNNYLEIVGARENNLKNLSVKIPLNILTVISGVSGSGKSTLIKKILLPSLQKIIGGYGDRSGKFDVLKGDYKLVTQIEYVDQNPIGKSSRSNPITYIKAYDEIRKLFADQQLSKQNGMKSGHFSFNVDGGRCDDCKGEGEIKVEMQFMADVYLVCESCKGQRFKQEVLDVTYQSKNIFQILKMTVDEAIVFFNQKKDGSLEKKILQKLNLLASVGLGYVHLGQSSSTLSGGESQRIKLASFLGKEKSSGSLFVFDEPTTGLHFHDIKKLLFAINALIERGNSVIIIEHNMEVIKSADWLIDMGPEGGDHGGYVVGEGTPEEIAVNPNSKTGIYLKEKLEQSSNL